MALISINGHRAEKRDLAGAPSFTESRSGLFFLMDDFPIVPPFIIADTPNPRRLTTLKAARDYLAEAMRLHRPNPWRELWHRFKMVKTEEEAIEAIGDLRELLVDEDLLLPSEGPARQPRRGR